MNVTDMDDVPFTEEEIKLQELKEQVRDEYLSCEPARQVIDSSDDTGCPYCGSYEGDWQECPECGHGQ